MYTTVGKKIGWQHLLLLSLIGGTLAIFIGIVSALGNKLLLLPIPALLGAAFVLATPATWSIWLLLISSFIIVGPITYFSGITQVQWLPALLGAMLLIQVIVYGMRNEHKQPDSKMPGHLLWIIVFLVVVAFATLIDSPRFSEFFISSRFYLFMWPVMLAFMLGMVKQEHIEDMWRILLLVVIIQVPMVFYQYFMVAKQSIRMSPWDAVVGTFPGQEGGGGQSAAMATFLLIAMLAAIALWRHKALSGKYLILLLLSGIGTLALAEVKAAVLLLPLVVVAYYRREILLRPFESLVFFMAAMLLVGGLFVGYEHFHYSGRQGSILNPNLPNTTMDRVLREIDPHNESPLTHQIGRVTHLVYWWDINVKGGDYQHTLFGYGMGSTQITNIGVGDLAKRFPYPLDVTSSTILLWETGIIGHIAFLFILLTGAWVSGRMAKQPCVPEMHKIFLRVGAIGLFLLAITLPYKNFAFRSIPIQFLMMLMLGQAAYWYRQAHSSPIKAW